MFDIAYEEEVEHNISSFVGGFYNEYTNFWTKKMF